MTILCDACRVQDADGEESKLLQIWIVFRTLETISLPVYLKKTIDYAKVA